MSNPDVWAQLTLFDLPAKPSRPPRVLMTLMDAGYDGRDVTAWWCPRCNYETGWLPETPRGRPPCPKCNQNVEPTVCPDCGSDHGCHECYGTDAR